LDTTFRRRIVEGRVQIKDLAVWLENLKTMGATFWDHHHSRIVLAEFLSMPSQECFRSRTKIDRHIPYPTFQAKNHLHLRVRRLLIMEAADGAFVNSAGSVDLNDMPCTNESLKFFSTKETRKTPAMIGYGVRINYGYTPDLRAHDLHGATHE
jgi:hypothetical protein